MAALADKIKNNPRDILGIDIDAKVPAHLAKGRQALIDSTDDDQLRAAASRIETRTGTFKEAFPLKKTARQR